MKRTHNHLVRKRTLNHLAEFNHFATWLSVTLQILSFVLEFHELNTFLKLSPNFLRRVNYNIILSSAIKSHAFIPYKESCFYKMKSFGKRKVLYFCLRLISRKCVYKVFTRNISGTVTDHIKFFLNFSHLKSYHKNQVHGSHYAQSNRF